MPILFNTSDLLARDLHRDELPLLQHLFEANPEYFMLVGGQPPLPDEAEREFDELPPAPLTFSRRWFAGIFDRQQQLQGLFVVISDLCAVGVWHTTLFFLTSSLHGTGAAARLQASFETWAMSAGAKWLRLGVVSGNIAAERFWSKCGYHEVRTREIPGASGETRTVRILIKPLTVSGLVEYLRLVPRDSPGASLP